MEAIKRACEILGSQAALAKAVGVTPQAVNQWINGHTTLTVERTKQIVFATAGQISAHDLMPEMFPKGFRFPDEPKPDRKKVERAA